MINIKGWRGLVCALVLIAAGAAMIIADRYGLRFAVPTAAGSAALIIAAVVIAPGRMSLSDRLGRRRRFGKRLRRRTPNMLYSVSKIGTVWGDGTASMYVAIAPAPFQISVVGTADPAMAPPTVPMDTLRRHMVQGDIRVDAITVQQYAYRRYSRSDYNDAYAAHVGNTDQPATVNTVIEVSVALSRSLQSVQARATDGSIPAAIGRTVHVAAARIEQKLNIDGYTARLLTRQEVEWHHLAVMRFLNDGLKHEKWDYLDGEERQSVLARPADWAPRSAARWYEVPAERMAAAYQIRPGRYRSSTDLVSAALAYTYAGAAKLPGKSLHLNRVVGEQGDLATRMLPLARTVDTPRDRADLELPASDTFPVAIPATGIGVYLGESTDDFSGGQGRVFVNLQTGGDILFVHAPIEFMASLAARASAVGATVGLHLGDNPIWETLAAHVNPEHMVVTPSHRTSVEVRRYEPGMSRPEIGTAVVAWCPQGIPDTAAYSISMSPDHSATITTAQGDASFRWAPSEAEEAFLPRRQHASAQPVMT